MFFCSDCGYESSGWLGKCPGCAAWNTFTEEKLTRVSNSGNDSKFKLEPQEPININAVSIDSEERYSTGMGEVDRVLGGGIVKGSLILIAGDPGIGKSTLLLQMCETMHADKNILYISGEESVKQIKMRADRLGVKSPRLFLVSETSYLNIEKLIETKSPEFLIIDSIQTLHDEQLSSSPGSVTQVREITGQLMRIAKIKGISILIVGHVTKDGSIAGPRVLEHMVDTVLYFEGERHMSYRVLRSVKNRFGSTNEIGVFEMRENGLEEVANPSLTMLSGRPIDVPGTAVVCCIEGSRPMLIEIQSLICDSSLSMPRRMTTGIDYNRVSLLMAVLEKRVGLALGRCDSYVNVIGGLKIVEPACDLGVVAAIASCFKNKVIDPYTVFIGEVGLTGEIRAVSHIDKRISEAFRLGFKHCIIPEGNKKVAMAFLETIKGEKPEIIYVDNVITVINKCLGVI